MIFWFFINLRLKGCIQSYKIHFFEKYAPGIYTMHAHSPGRNFTLK